MRRESQAVWRRERGTPEIAWANFLDHLARPASTSCSSASRRFHWSSRKNPGPPGKSKCRAQNQRYSARGNPPSRLIWLHLPEILEGCPPPKRMVLAESRPRQLAP